ncbi:MAG: hypothetical protein HQL59_06280 [Magnetococcales bacterium]|nr:hypothetical protein [Magnetococcales bacterium]
MKQLGDLVLPDSLQWKNQYEWSPTVQETARTLGGNLVVWNSGLIGGRPIDLEAEGDSSWLTLEQVRAIHAMAMQPGGVFDLILDNESFQVMFRHQDQPATSFTPIYPHGRFFNGLIKLMQV